MNRKQLKEGLKAYDRENLFDNGIDVDIIQDEASDLIRIIAKGKIGIKIIQSEGTIPGQAYASYSRVQQQVLIKQISNQQINKLKTRAIEMEKGTLVASPTIEADTWGILKERSKELSWLDSRIEEVQIIGRN